MPARRSTSGPTSTPSGLIFYDLLVGRRRIEKDRERLQRVSRPGRERAAGHPHHRSDDSRAGRPDRLPLSRTRSGRPVPDHRRAQGRSRSPRRRGPPAARDAAILTRKLMVGGGGAGGRAAGRDLVVGQPARAGRGSPIRSRFWSPISTTRPATRPLTAPSSRPWPSRWRAPAFISAIPPANAHQIAEQIQPGQPSRREHGPAGLAARGRQRDPRRRHRPGWRRSTSLSVQGPRPRARTGRRQTAGDRQGDRRRARMRSSRRSARSPPSSAAISATRRRRAIGWRRPRPSPRPRSRPCRPMRGARISRSRASSRRRSTAYEEAVASRPRVRSRLRRDGCGLRQSAPRGRGRGELPEGLPAPRPDVRARALPDAGRLLPAGLAQLREGDRELRDPGRALPGRRRGLLEPRLRLPHGARLRQGGRGGRRVGRARLRTTSSSA